MALLDLPGGGVHTTVGQIKNNRKTPQAPGYVRRVLAADAAIPLLSLRCLLAFGLASSTVIATCTVNTGRLNERNYHDCSPSFLNHRA